jgi:hypothetical protein
VGLASKPTPSASISVAAEVNLPEAYTNFDPTIVASGFEPYQPYKLVFCASALTPAIARIIGIGSGTVDNCGNGADLRHVPRPQKHRKFAPRTRWN